MLSLSSLGHHSWLARVTAPADGVPPLIGWAAAAAPGDVAATAAAASAVVAVAVRTSRRLVATGAFEKGQRDSSDIVISLNS
jgi:hypothetical protein